MSLETAGLDLSHLDQGIRPQDDMYRHFNGTWLKNAVIPSDRASDGAFTALHIEAEARVREIIETASRSDEAKKLGDIYASFMDANSVETKSAKPIAQDLSAVDSIENLEGFIEVLAKLEALGVSGIFGTFIYADMKDASTNILYMQQGGLSLPDEAYYREEQYLEIRKAYVAHVAKMFELAAVAHAKDLA